MKAAQMFYKGSFLVYRRSGVSSESLLSRKSSLTLGILEIVKVIRFISGHKS